MAIEEQTENAMRIYPMGVNRNSKEQILAMIPEDQREEARALLRTPEENAVIFAKISRKSASFDEIASGVDEEGASKFHQKWTVSDLGYGHKSVGEHAIIQMAVENVASIDGDEITDNRLGSYTEFSARFKGRQTTTWFTPESVRENPELFDLWTKTHQRLFAACDEATNRATTWVNTPEAKEAFPQLRQGYYNPNETPGAHRSRIFKHGCDAFKDMMPVSRLTSMGVTWNATEAEHAITKLLSSPSQSTREVGGKMKEAALEVAPTLVKYADFNPYLASIDTRRDNVVDAFQLEGKLTIDPESDIKTRIIKNSNPENLILAAFAYESSRTGDYGSLVEKISNLSDKGRKMMLEMILTDQVTWFDFAGTTTSNGISTHVLPPRAFEFDGGNVYEMRNMNYGPWREFKRHRMQTYAAKPLDIKWGYLIPPLADVLDKSEDEQFHGTIELVKNAISEMEELFRAVREVDPVDARYAVTRLHYRPAISRMNMREMFHYLPLRARDSALPFIRRLVWPTDDVLSETNPNIARHIKLKGERLPIWFP